MGAPGAAPPSPLSLLGLPDRELDPRSPRILCAKPSSAEGRGDSAPPAPVLPSLSFSGTGVSLGRGAESAVLERLPPLLEQLVEAGDDVSVL